MIEASEHDLNILKGILKKYPYQFYVFGSRSKKNSRKYSDLDICYKVEIPANVIVEIRDELEKSDLSFRVDIVFWDNLPDSYKKLIEKDLTPL